MNSSQSTAPQPTPARSMTGYARVRKSTGQLEITLSVKAVNHRALDVHFHCPSELDALENEMRAVVRRKLIRGHVEVRIAIARPASESGPTLNKELLEAYVAAFRDTAAAYDVGAALDLNLALTVPGMFAESGERDLDPETNRVILQALSEALDSLNISREREATELVAAMLRHNTSIRQSAAELADIRTRAIPAFEARLNERLRELLRAQAVDPQRLAQEVAMLVDKSDITEEIARLQIHAGQLEALLNGGGEIGKRLDFLLQEMNRETNTILSKTTGIGELGLRITDLALGAKADIEKIREQSLNLE
jgi:uncharacterized protein (TIGR00255 family)